MVRDKMGRNNSIFVIIGVREAKEWKWWRLNRLRRCPAICARRRGEAFSPKNLETALIRKRQLIRMHRIWAIYTPYRYQDVHHRENKLPTLPFTNQYRCNSDSSWWRPGKQSGWWSWAYRRYDCSHLSKACDGTWSELTSTVWMCQQFRVLHFVSIEMTYFYFSYSFNYLIIVKVIN